MFKDLFYPNTNNVHASVTNSMSYNITYKCSIVQTKYCLVSCKAVHNGAVPLVYCECTHLNNKTELMIFLFLYVHIKP